jgi:hypothetical protein
MGNRHITTDEEMEKIVLVGEKRWGTMTNSGEQEKKI